jgi:hypothetical protein
MIATTPREQEDRGRPVPHVRSGHGQGPGESRTTSRRSCSTREARLRGLRLASFESPGEAGPSRPFGTRPGTGGESNHVQTFLLDAGGASARAATGLVRIPRGGRSLTSVRDTAKDRGRFELPTCCVRGSCATVALPVQWAMEGRASGPGPLGERVPPARPRESLTSGTKAVCDGDPRLAAMPLAEASRGSRWSPHPRWVREATDARRAIRTRVATATGSHDAGLHQPGSRAAGRPRR